MGLFRKNEGNLGLDIGSHLVKLVELRPRDDRLELGNLAVAQLYEPTEERENLPYSDRVVDTVRSLVESSGIRTRRAAIAMSSREVIVKRIEIDRMSEAEVRQIIKWEAEQHIPFNIDDVYIDFHILDVDADGKAEQMDVLLVAGKKMNVDARLDLVRASGLEPVIVDVDAFAIQNAFELNYPEASGEIVCLLNIGRDVSVISLVHAGKPLFIRDIPFGSSDYVDKLRRGLGISVEDAESYILGICPEAVNPEEVRPFITSASDDLIVGITRTFSYLKTLGDEEKPRQVFLSGGGARIPSLKEVLEERFDVTIEVSDPLRKVHVPEGLLEGDSIREISPLLMQAVGLGLR